MELNIFYDGECPFCSKFIQLSQLKQKYNVTLYNLRENPDKVKYFTSQGYDINKGMIVTLNDKIYYGHEAVHIISVLSNQDNWIGKFYYFLFSKKIITKILYPFLRTGRNIILFILGRKKI